MTRRKRGRTHQYNIAEAKTHLPTLVRETLSGAEVIIARDNKPLVKLVPLSATGWTAGSAKGQVTMSSDFEAPLEDFDEYR